MKEFKNSKIEIYNIINLYIIEYYYVLYLSKINLLKLFKLFAKSESLDD